MFIRRQKIIVYMTNQMLMASLWYGKQYQSHQTYQNQETGHTEFRQYLLQHKKATVYLVIDAIEEEYQLERLPHVTGYAGREMLTRKLTQFSRNSVYKAACFLRRETTARKDNIFVLLALTNTSFLQHWMEIIQSEKALLAGVYTLPIMCQTMMRQMKSAPPQILVCECLSSGLRQTYLQHGGLRISRLTPIDPLPAMRTVDWYLSEIEKMQRYLLSQRMISDEIVLQVMLSSFDAVSNEIAKALEQRGVECLIVDKQDAMIKRNLKPTDVQTYPELQYMQLLSYVTVPPNLAPAEMIKTYGIRQLTNKIYMTTAMMGLIGLIVALNFFSQGIEEEKQISQLVQQTNSLLKQHAFVVNHYPKTPISGDELKAVVATAQMINQSLPLSLMQVISTVLDEMPEVTINRIRWVQSEREDVEDGESGSIAKIANITDERSIGDLLHIGFVDANIKPIAGDYQKALASANRFVANLRADSRVMRVQVMQVPINENALASAQGSTNDETTTQLATIKFKLKIILNQLKKESL
jgi:hypothetical protein